MYHRKFSTNSAVALVCYVCVCIFALICLLPFLLVLSGSFSTESDILKNGFELFPRHATLAAYQFVLAGSRVYNAYKVTTFVTIVGTLYSLVLTAMFAYGISVKALRFRNVIAFFAYFTMLFSGGMVSFYILVTQVLHMGNTLLSLILPYGINTFNMLLMRNFFQSLPSSIMESAKIDGAGEMRVLFQIVLPLALPSVATIALFYSLQYWNDWWLGILFIDNNKLYPLQLLLRALLSVLDAAKMNPHENFLVTPTYSVRMATCLLTIGPILFVYPFIQRYFVKGLTVGGVKG